jgi:hypothetical protein
MLLPFVIAVVLEAGLPTPSPGPFPLKEIASVRSTPFCTALRDNIAPAILHVLDNDQHIAASRPVFPKLYHDAVVFQSGFAEFDYIKLNNLVLPMARNLRAVKGLLGDKNRFPAKAQTQDEADLLALRDRLQKIAQVQNDALNVIGGLTATEQLGELQQAGTGPDVGFGPQPEGVVPGINSRAGLPRMPGDPIDPAVDLPPAPLSNPFAPFETEVIADQAVIDRRENDAAQAIFAVLPRCRPIQTNPTNPTSSPSPAESP